MPITGLSDWALRLAVQETLQSLGVFDIVTLNGPPEVGPLGQSYNYAVSIEPSSNADRDIWDNAATGGLTGTVSATLTFYARNETQSIRDAVVEWLFNNAANALNGQIILAGYNSPELSRFTSRRYLPQTPPERRIEAVYQYTYVLPSWTSFDTTQPQGT
jgi:hypothetical protein